MTGRCSVLTGVLLLGLYVGINAKTANAESTMNCPSGTYDMLDWMTLDSSLRSTYHSAGNANPLYTTIAPGKFYWSKGSNGSPWDIQLYDSKYIYLWITESDWNDATTYKKFTYNKNVPLVQRCAKAGFPGSSIKVPNTSYQAFTDCNHYTTHGLLKSINELWGPYKLSMGGTLPAGLNVLVASYRYNCDNNYTNCGDKEEYYLTQKYGLVQWVHYVLKNGLYQMQQKTLFNQLTKGTAAPAFACF
jgi:hypothetical protein